MKTLRFVTHNKFKAQEVGKILTSVNVVAANLTILELQTEDTQALVKDKALKAFKKLGQPLFVEHTGLYLDRLNGLPGGLTEIFWNKIGKDRFTELFKGSQVTAVTVIGYIDGKSFHSFKGSVVGTVADSPRVDHGFQWDCVFIPDGYKETFSEMGEKKNEISMRRVALNNFATFLEGSR